MHFETIHPQNETLRFCYTTHTLLSLINGCYGKFTKKIAFFTQTLVSIPAFFNAALL